MKKKQLLGLNRVLILVSQLSRIVQREWLHPCMADSSILRGISPEIQESDYKRKIKTSIGDGQVLTWYLKKT